MNKKVMINVLLAFLIVAVLIGGCSNKDPLVGEWVYHSSGSIYLNDCPISMEFFEDGTIKVPSASGTYKDMGGDQIMISLDPIYDFNGFKTGTVYEYGIIGEILSFKSNNFYCEFTRPSSGGDITHIPSPTVTAQHSPEQNSLLASVRDKGKIVFASTDKGWNIYTINPDGSDLKLLAKTALSPDCSPDGKQIAAADILSKLFIINVDGTNRVDISTTDGVATPKWSPDGKRIVYVSGEMRQKGEIYIINTEGSEQTQLTSTGKDNILPIWISDGEIAFFARAENKYYIMTSDGSDVNEISEEMYFGYAKGWSPDRSAYVIEMLTPSDLLLFNADGSVSISLMQGDFIDFSATWCP